MIEFTLRIDKDINDKLDDISLKTYILKSNLISFAIYQYMNNDSNINFKYQDKDKFRNSFRLSNALNNFLTKKTSELGISKNLYINSLLREFINSFEYI
ncbi:hypothetical protein [Streptobacillus moniliformis]|uniref:hypothetical protein n=1 Tax=Streptobacillus moniliformis TaxID=34105 RepID=UPI0007E40F38|nr:hypothetical protein [Streptobacillus moniliformis]